jgi:hypothetical protein
MRRTAHSPAYEVTFVRQATGPVVDRPDGLPQPAHAISGPHPVQPAERGRTEMVRTMFVGSSWCRVNTCRGPSCAKIEKAKQPAVRGDLRVVVREHGHRYAGNLAPDDQLLQRRPVQPAQLVAHLGSLCGRDGVGDERAGESADFGAMCAQFAGPVRTGAGRSPRGQSSGALPSG